MSKVNWRFVPVNGYDIPALECWLEQMAARGRFFTLSAGLLVGFEGRAPAHVRIHLEPCREKTDEDDLELNQLYEAAGWRYLGIFRKNYYVFSTEDLQAQAHTDPDVLNYSLQRFTKQRILGGIGLAVLNLLLLPFFLRAAPLSLLWRLELRYFPATTITRHPLVAVGLGVFGLLLIDFSYLKGLAILFRLRRRLAKEGALPHSSKKRFGGWALALGSVFLCVALVNFVSDTGEDRIPAQELGWISLSELEGEAFALSPDHFYTGNDVLTYSHPFRPDCWFFSQRGSVMGTLWPEDLRPDSAVPSYTPEWTIQAYRFALPWTADQMLEEWTHSFASKASHKNLGQPNEFLAYPPPEGVDHLFVLLGDVHQTLLLQKGNVVMRVEYYGLVDVTQHLEQFSAVIATL